MLAVAAMWPRRGSDKLCALPANQIRTRTILPQRDPLHDRRAFQCLDQASIVEALPHITPYDEATSQSICGHAMGAEELAKGSRAISCSWSKPHQNRWWCTAAARSRDPAAADSGHQVGISAGLRITDARDHPILSKWAGALVNSRS